MEHFAGSRRHAQWPGGGDFWFERLDVQRHRSFVPIVSVPQLGDAQVSRVGGLLDRALTRSLSSVVLASSAPTMLRGVRELDRLKAEWDFYTREAFLADESRFYKEPADVEPRRHAARRVTFRPRDGDVCDLTFKSGYLPQNLAVRAPYMRFEGNATAHARFWRHEGPPRPTAVCVHGYLLHHHSLNTELFNIRWLYKRGMNVMLFILPFHGDRKVAAINGLAFPDFNMSRLAEAFAHAVHDFRVFLSWLLRQGAPSVGVIGASLGGYFASLLATLEDRLEFAVPMIPAASLPDTVMDWHPAVEVLSAFLHRLDWDMDEIRRHAAIHTPMQHLPKLSPERMLIIGAQSDCVTRPYNARLLWEHFGGPEIHWFAGSHAMHSRRATYLRALGRFLGSLGAFDVEADGQDLEEIAT